MSSPDGAAGGVAARALLRATAFLVLWLVLAGADPVDLVAGRWRPKHRAGIT